MSNLNQALKKVSFSAFEGIEQAIQALKHKNFIRLHQGKTTFSPCADLSNWRPGTFELEPHEHASPKGINMLKDRILMKNQNKAWARDNILITCGATHAIGIALRAILNAQDEVLVLSPQWLFAVGLIKAANGIAVEVPVFLELCKDSNFDFIKELTDKVSGKTRALYFNTPNNPTGYSFNAKQLQDLVSFAKAHHLWIIADNAYENYDYTEHGFIDIISCKEAKGRTFSIYSFSKTYAMPGYRIGYSIFPDDVSVDLMKWGLYSLYAVATPSQFAAYHALNTAPETLIDRKYQAMIARNLVLKQLQVPHTAAQGGLYVFLDLCTWQDGSAENFIQKCIQTGVSLAPGSVFGRHCEQYARLCFTATDLANLGIAIEKINSVYNGGR